MERVGSIDDLVAGAAAKDAGEHHLRYGLVIVEHARRRVVHFSVTEHPTAEWVVLQLRQAFSYDTAPRYLIFDRDSIFNERVVAAIRGMATEPARTAFRAPWQNPIAERLVGTIRRGMLDHVVVFGEDHLRRLMADLFRYYHADRTHLGLEKDCPEPRVVTPRPEGNVELVSLPRVGGIHHRYEWRERA